MSATTEVTAVERELAIAASPETVWEFLVDPKKAVRWMGSGDLRAPTRRAVPRRRGPRQHRRREVRRDRPATPARLHVGLGERTGKLGAARLDDGRVRSDPRATAARCCASGTATSPAASRPSLTATAGITTSSASQRCGRGGDPGRPERQSGRSERRRSDDVHRTTSCEAPAGIEGAEAYGSSWARSWRSSTTTRL